MRKILILPVLFLLFNLLPFQGRAAICVGTAGYNDGSIAVGASVTFSVEGSNCCSGGGTGLALVEVAWFWFDGESWNFGGYNVYYAPVESAQYSIGCPYIALNQDKVKQKQLYHQLNDFQS
ncbi:hypothetical protein [Runella sp.]|jgi:hypothetical protein|uniref:hypothetical protein n=1 Tax=Runella sp. TaxID=1960881 RepID=UPI003016DE34